MLFMYHKMYWQWLMELVDGLIMELILDFIRKDFVNSLENYLKNSQTNI